MSVVCAPCSYGSGRDRVQVRHDSIALVALHSRRGAPVRVVTSAPALVVEDDNRAEYELALAEAAEAPVVEAPAFAAGQVWVLDGVLWQVRKARSSDRLFGHQLVNEPTREVGPLWAYRGVASRVLRGARLASREEVRAFGHRVQCCVFCSKQLDDERSRWAGYGEKCAGNRRLPWGERPPVGWSFGG